MKKIHRSIQGIKHGGFRSLLLKAKQLGIQVTFFEHRLTLLEHAGQKKFISNNSVPMPKTGGNYTGNKQITKLILEEIGVNVPRGVVIKKQSELFSAVKSAGLKYPLIAKPLSGSLASGVTWNIRDKKELRKAFVLALEAEKTGELKKESILVEEMFIGNEYRILILNGKVLSCVQKIPAGVTGDGQSDIQTLVHRRNKERALGFKIKLDKIALATLQKNKLSLISVLPKGTFFPLRHNLNMSDGGRAVECTNKVSKKYRAIAEKSVAALGLTYGGIDFFTKDLSSSSEDYVIIEINPNPFYNMHEKPLVEGKGIDVSSEILKSIFPKLKTR